MYLSFSTSLIFFFLQSALFPGFVFLAFAPFLTLAMLKKPLTKCFALAFISGAIMDLLSSDPMGVHALNYVIVTFFLYKARKFFLYEEPHHVGLFTALFSFSSTLLQLFILFLFKTQPSFTGKWFISDLILMALADGIYAMLLFGYPIKGKQFWHPIKKKLFHISPSSALKQLFKQVKS